MARAPGRLFDTLNLRNSFDAMPSGDFTAPTYGEALFPFSSDQAAMPVGDNRNIAMRLRGYLNVADNKGGQPVTFAVKVDDGAVVKIGKSQMVLSLLNDDLPQASRPRRERRGHHRYGPPHLLEARSKQPQRAFDHRAPGLVFVQVREEREVHHRHGAG